MYILSHVYDNTYNYISYSIFDIESYMYTPCCHNESPSHLTVHNDSLGSSIAGGLDPPNSGFGYNKKIF